jgi:hypothetical protein
VTNTGTTIPRSTVIVVSVAADCGVALAWGTGDCAVDCAREIEANEQVIAANAIALKMNFVTLLYSFALGVRITWDDDGAAEQRTGR